VSTLSHDQVIRIAAEVSSGSSWEQRTDQVPDTAEAHDMWDRITANVAGIVARGNSVDLPHELAI
jgi:hypothetical protein